MKKTIFSTLFLTSIISSLFAQEIEYAEYIANGSNSSYTNLDAIFKVTKGDKSTLYRYTTGKYSGLVEKLCTGETFPFQIRNTKDGQRDVNSIWSPIPYFEAYYKLQNKTLEPGIRLVTKTSSDGSKQICMEDLKTCIDR